MIDLFSCSWIKYQLYLFKQGETEKEKVSLSEIRPRFSIKKRKKRKREKKCNVSQQIEIVTLPTPSIKITKIEPMSIILPELWIAKNSLKLLETKTKQTLENLNFSWEGGWFWSRHKLWLLCGTLDLKEMTVNFYMLVDNNTKEIKSCFIDEENSVSVGDINYTAYTIRQPNKLEFCVETSAEVSSIVIIEIYEEIRTKTEHKHIKTKHEHIKIEHEHIKTKHEHIKTEHAEHEHIKIEQVKTN